MAYYYVEPIRRLPAALPPGIPCTKTYYSRTKSKDISKKLYKLGLIYRDLSRLDYIQYIGHAFKHGINVSGIWIKDPRYANEAEFRFAFFPLLKKDGVPIRPTINKDKSVTFRGFDKFTLQSQIIKCKEIIKCCRWK